MVRINVNVYRFRGSMDGSRAAPIPSWGISMHIYDMGGLRTAYERMGGISAMRWPVDAMSTTSMGACYAAQSD